MTHLRSPSSGLIAATAVAALLITGCSSNEADREATADSADAPVAAGTSVPTPVVDDVGGNDLVIYDNDWTVPGASSILPLLAAPNVTVLGTTTVTGDGFASQGVADALSFFEQIGETGVPVVQGFEFPLVNTAARTYARQKMYGSTNSWQGAFNASEDDPNTPAVDPGATTKPPFGWAKALAVHPEHAEDFMIEQVRAHPNQVTIVTAGPLTNVAAAVRKDPEFASLTKGIVIGGGNLYQLSPGERDAEFDSSAGFNFRFDPEAAHIVLTADWPTVTAVGDITGSVVFDDGMMKAIKSKDTSTSEYVVEEGYAGWPIWDETTVAVAVDPSVIKQSIELRMDVDISGGPEYGMPRVWSVDDSPGLGEVKLTYVQGIDEERVAQMFVDSTHATFD